MKKYILSIMAMMTIALTANAMSFTQAQREALFLTDKMAYELNLTDDQYDACYEINLDYLMGVSTVDDLYGTYWTRRNIDLGYILLDWQLSAFRAASYFYRPLYWDAGWHFGIYARYPRRSFYYFSRPTVYVSYRGGHSWRMNGGRSYYHGRQDHFRRPSNNHFGMRDRFDNKRPNNHFDKNRPNNNRHDNNRYDNKRHDRPNSLTPSHRNDNNGNFRLDRNNRTDRNNNRIEHNNNNRVDRNTNGDRNYRNENRGRIDRNSSTRVTVNRGSNGMNHRFSNGSSSSNRSNSGSSFNRGGSSMRSNSSVRSGSSRMGGSRSMSHSSGNSGNSSRHR